MNEVTKPLNNLNFVDVYNEYKDRIELYLRTLVKNDEIRKDVLSDTFMKVFEKLHTYNPARVKLSTWLHTIARNNVIDMVRKDKVTGRDRLRYESELNNTENDSSFEFTNTHEVSADKQLENNELADKIMDAFENIKPSYKEVAIQHFIYEQDYNEIADKLDMPLNTVKVAIMRAREVLQGALKFEYATL